MAPPVRLTLARACLCALALTAFALVTRPLAATTMTYQTTLDLLKASDAVIVGQVTATRCEERNGQIVTITTVRVDETWKGQTTTKTIDLVEPGGIVGDHGSATGGMPQFQTGDRIVAFLTKLPADPNGSFGVTTGVAGRHLVIDAPTKTPGAATPAILARPSADANCDIAGHDAAGRTVLLENGVMMQREGLLGTTLDQFRAEVTGYQKALAAGETPPLSDRDQQLVKAFQDALNHDSRHTRTGSGGTGGQGGTAGTPDASTALPPSPIAQPTTLTAGPGIVMREENIARLLRENQERLAAEHDATESSHRLAWIVFVVSGISFVALTLILRRRKG